MIKNVIGNRSSEATTHEAIWMDGQKPETLRARSVRKKLGAALLAVAAISCPFAPGASAMRDNTDLSPGTVHFSGGDFSGGNLSNATLLVPIDLQTVNVKIQVDDISHKIRATATADFVMQEDGNPYFDLKPAIQFLDVDHDPDIDTRSMRTASDPRHAATFRYIDKTLSAGLHSMSMSYEIEPSEYCSFQTRRGTQSFDCLFFMYDLTERTFFEQYAPSNFEFDRYQMTMTIQIPASFSGQTVMSNADSVERSGNSFKLIFPEFYNTSCFFIHIIPTSEYQIVTTREPNHNFPITVYSRNSMIGPGIMSDVTSAFLEMSSRFGPTKHKRFTVLMDTQFPGGMEFAGASITNGSAVAHEISHNWFARGTLPANGNAGWIDEGIATWRDNGYPAYSSADAEEGKLGAGSPFQRLTPRNSYTDGARFFSRAHFELRHVGGIFPLLREFHARYFGVPITSEGFLDFMNATTGMDFQGLFDQFIF